MDILAEVDLRKRKNTRNVIFEMTQIIGIFFRTKIHITYTDSYDGG